MAKSALWLPKTNMRTEGNYGQRPKEAKQHKAAF